MNIASPIIMKQEAYCLNKSPVASTMGLMVGVADQPIHRQKGIKPFYVSDKSRMRFYCPEDFRIYADRVEGFVPIWLVGTLPNYYSLPTRLLPPRLTPAESELNLGQTYSA